MSGERVDDLAAVLKPLGALQARRMFGGVGLYLDGVFFALIAAGELYFKVDDGNRAAYERAGAEPFRPYADRPETSMGYFRVPLEIEEDPRELCAWAQEALGAARRRDAAQGRKRRR
jgi:DNA transformation protein